MAQALAFDAQRTAQRALASSPVYALRELRVDRVGERLRIRGRVSSFYHKQLAQETVREATQQIDLENAVDVRETPS